MKRLDMSRYIPLGRTKSQMIEGGMFAGVVAVLRAVVELMDNYIHARDALYEITPPVGMTTVHRVLIPGAVIRPFSSLIQSSLDFFPIFWFFMGLEVIACYLWHRKETMSIYLMRRLPNQWELHRRCWGRPLIYTAGSFLVMGLILAFYFLVYLVFTPRACLPF